MSIVKRTTVFSLALFAALGLSPKALGQVDVTQPGDPIIPSSSNSPGSEGVANVIDNQPTKYLNFDSGRDGAVNGFSPSGFVVSPSVGRTVITGLTMTSANDGPERDPKAVTVEGSDDDAVTSFSAGNWQTIATITDIPAFEARFEKKSFSFANTRAYRHYRWTLTEAATTPNGCCMQIAEVELLGTVVPGDITQPTDAIIPSSSNSPGSEGVANVIDNQPTKYLNFDSGRDGAVSGFSPSGFIVTPQVGLTKVTGVSMKSANDGPERDPKRIKLEGSNDGAITDFASGTWEQIVDIADIPVFAGRFQNQTFTFANAKYYRHYRWTLTEAATTPNGCCMQIAEVELLGTVLPSDVTQPGDAIIPSSSNSPGSEGVANVIDNQPTKYLNFDSGRDGAVSGFSPSGFVVTPAVGRTVVSAITMQSANDAIERDPKAITLEGSNDDTVTAFNAGNWEPIATLTDIPAFAARFQKQTFLFDNYKPFKHYRWTLTEAATTPNGCCMQIAEVELHGTAAPRDITQPGDPIIPSSSNSPGSEGVANIIDDQPTKYLNFDSGRDGAVSGFSPSGFAVSPRVPPAVVTGMTIQSANDGPERDPTIVTLEGSNDDALTAFNSGTWEQIVRIENIPPFAARFERKEFYFANTKTYKHYRWIVHQTTTTPNGCCMQVAEVELLAVTGNDCNANPPPGFVTPPADTYVLSGSTATFYTKVNGPWQLQWRRNGQPISGATALTYTTPAITAANANDEYTVEIVGCSVSDPVKAVIHTPTLDIISLNWNGGGANGAPTAMNDDDVAGLELAAHWNNLETQTATVDPGVLNTSKGTPHAAISVDFAASGQWGVGTGTDDANRRMLNGTAVNTGAPSVDNFGRVTFYGVPAGEHSLIAYSVQVPLEFFQVDYTVTSTDAGGNTITQSQYMRPLNADEYNADPGWKLGAGKTADARGVGNVVRFNRIVVGTDGIVELTWRSPDWFQPAGAEPRRGPALNGLQLVLNKTYDELPVVTGPVARNAFVGGKLELSATVVPANAQLQWLKDGVPIAGATSATLVIGQASAGDIGRYQLRASNSAGSVESVAVLSDVLTSKNIAEDLVVHLKFDETSGLSAANSAAGGTAGQLKGFEATAGSQWKAGRVGGALSFDGASTFVFVPQYTKPGSAMTVSAWVNGSSAGGSIVNNWVPSRVIGNKGAFFLRAAPNTDAEGNPIANLAGVIAVGPNEPSTVLDVPSPANTWHHLVLTADGLALRLYVNGVLRATSDYTGNLNNLDAIKWLSVGATLRDNQLDDTQDPPVTVPIDPPIVDADNGAVWGGLIDDVAVWARALDGSEVQAIYTGGQGGQNAAAVASPLPDGEQSATPELSAARDGNVLVLTYTGGRLITSHDVDGPWFEVTNATTPYRVTTDQAMRFYSVIAGGTLPSTPMGPCYDGPGCTGGTITNSLHEESACRAAGGKSWGGPNGCVTF